MLALKQSTSAEENIEESAHATVNNLNNVDIRVMISPKLKKYKVRSHAGTESPSSRKGSDHLRIPSIAQGYSSSDHSSNSRTQQHRHDSNEIPVFNPSPPTSNKRRHVPPPAHNALYEANHPRSNTLPTIHPHSASSPTPRAPLHHKQISLISEKRTRNKNKRKKKKVSPKKKGKKNKRKKLPQRSTELIRSDSELFGGPKPYFVVRTPVTAGPFSPFPTTANLSRHSDSSDAQFPDTEWVQRPQSPQTVTGYPRTYEDGYENPFSPRTHARIIEQERQRRRPQTARKSLEKQGTHRSLPRTVQYQSHNAQNHRKHHSEHKLRRKHQAKHGKHYKSSTMTMTKRNATQYAHNYAAYAEQEKERRKRKKTKKKTKTRKKRQTEPTMPHTLNLYHIVSDDEEFSHISSRNDAILYQ